MPTWEWIGQHSASKRLGEQQEDPGSDGEYGTTHLTDNVPPQFSTNLSAKFATLTEAETEENRICKRGVIETFTLAFGGTIQGKVVSTDVRYAGGGKFELRVIVRRTDKNVAQASISSLGL